MHDEEFALDLVAPPLTIARHRLAKAERAAERGAQKDCETNALLSIAASVLQVAEELRWARRAS